MSLTLPGPWYIGKCTALFTVTPQTISSDGTTLTAASGASFSMLAIFDSTEFDLQTRTENIKSASAGIDNEVIISDTLSARLTEIIAANGNSKLATAYLAYDYFVLTFQAAPNAGTGTVGKLWTIPVVRKGVTPQYNEGKSTCTGTFGPAGLAPTFA